MRIADQYLKEVIDHHGLTQAGAPLSREAVLRIALDLREAREHLRNLKRDQRPLGKIVDYRA
jgi:hypothetical protein